jgi:hypothetical protein
MEIYTPHISGGKNTDFEEHLTGILYGHMRNTFYWKNKLTPSKIDELINSDFEQTLYNLSCLEVDHNQLRYNWEQFTPAKLNDKALSTSSGTTGVKKQCYWSMSSLDAQAEFMHYYLSDDGVRMDDALIQGPPGAYIGMNERLVRRFGSTPYSVPIPIDGLKNVMDEVAKKGRQEMVNVMFKHFGKEIKESVKILKDHDSITFMRSAWHMLLPFEQFFGEKRNIDTVLTSGVALASPQYEALQKKFGKAIPVYGYFAFGDAYGKYQNGNLDYYPQFPNAIFTTLKKDGEIASFGEEGNPLFVIARPDLFLVMKETNETVNRAPPSGKFHWEGIRNPRR